MTRLEINLKKLVVSSLVLAALAACSAPPGERVTGAIIYYGEGPVITVPNVVQQGDGFDVKITTFGGGCTVLGGVDFDVEGLSATLTPYDYNTATAATSCSTELKRLEHTATFKFDEAGTATIAVKGLSEDDSGAVETTITRTIEVR